jgi:16S rRNA (guanine1516-N2)-methyltransferase
VLDATAGLGADAFVLASLGCQVTMCERSQVMAALLADGLDRAREVESTAVIVGERMQLIDGDSLAFLNRDCQIYDTIYLDPMYPHRRNTALNSQAMRTIRSLVGDDDDCGDLFDAALKRARNRVVVKRPKGAPTLTATVPSHVISMKNSRFDIYLTFAA